jgi:hypothetical protein
MKFNSDNEPEQEEVVLDPDEDEEEEDEEEDDMNDLWEDCIFPADDTEEGA